MTRQLTDRQLIVGMIARAAGASTRTAAHLAGCSDAGLRKRLADLPNDTDTDTDDTPTGKTPR